MGLSSTTRVIRGGRAVETVYWHYTKDKSGLQKIFKHRNTLVFPKKMVPKMPNVADQAFSKIK